MKRRALLGTLPLVIAGCSAFSQCKPGVGQVYNLEDKNSEVLILDRGPGWLHVEFIGELDGEYRCNKESCNDRYCRYEIETDSFVQPGLRFDCADKSAKFYV